jgi:nucleoside-diphosphate-sugar epimerase
MTVVIAGGHGKIGRLLGARLARAGTDVRGLIRNPAHEDDLQRAGITPIVHDLETETAGLDEIVAGAGAVVFAAGAGAGSGDARKQTMDRDGAIKLMDACQATGVRRYLMVSSMGARDPELPGDGFAAYLRAKAQADAALAHSGLDFTIVRPGGLTDDRPRDRVTVGSELPSGQIPRQDVAAVLAALLDAPNTIGAAFDLVSGDTPIARALAALAPDAGG